MKARTVLIACGIALICASPIILAFATGATFGQRCTAAGHAPGSPAWEACLGRVSTGGGA